MKRLRVEELERRDTPSASNVLADIEFAYLPGTFDAIMPDVPRANIRVLMVKSDPLDPASQFLNVFTAHGDGMGGRVTVQEADTGRVVHDVIAFEDSFRGGVGASAEANGELFVTAGKGGGPRVVAIDLTTFETRSFFVPGADLGTRTGTPMTTADIDHVNGSESASPGVELLLLSGTGAGQTVSVLDPVTGFDRLPPIRVGAPDGHPDGLWEFVPAGAGVDLPGGVGQGFLLQMQGEAEADAQRFSSRGFTWTGIVSPHDHTFPGVI